MRKTLKSAGVSTIATLLTLMNALVTALPACAENKDVEATMESLNDLSMFDQGLATTGVAAELRDNRHYTIFAPVNASFSTLPPSAYPCFYAAPCRPQIAALLRDHIVVGRHDAKEMATFDDNQQTLGGRPVHIEEPYKGEYTVNGHKILSKAESNGNIIYRIDGLLADADDMAPFRAAVSQVPPGAIIEDSMTTYTTPLTPDAVAPIPSPDATDTATQTVTVVQHTVVAPE